MIPVGIDDISFYTSCYYLDLAILARARGIDVNKFYIGLGQHKMAVVAPDEDIVTMGANAAKAVLDATTHCAIDTVLFATESGIDQSKSAGIYVHSLLDLSPQCRVVELKQACHSATSGLQLAAAMVRQSPNHRILLIAADIARYGFNSSGESSQGCGAVAMVISAKPRLLVLEQACGIYTSDIQDFWRPNYRDEALVEGRYSTKMYLYALKQAWQHYQQITKRRFVDHDYFLYHTPVPRLVEKAHKELAWHNNISLTHDEITNTLRSALYYNREIGNSYTAALYISLTSLLDNDDNDLSGKRLGFYSYGSGCVAEYFSGVIQPQYQSVLKSNYHHHLLNSRQALTMQRYQTFYDTTLPTDGSSLQLPAYCSGHFRLAGIENHKRIYRKKPVNHALKATSKALSPAKLIISGEHAVVYGKPAIAIAINRFAKAWITNSKDLAVDFNLFDLRYHKSIALQTLRDLKNGLKRKYNKFLQGQCTINDVLRQPFHLVQFIAAHLMDHISPEGWKGFKIKTQSDIPLGCGMGSSAAITLSVLKALATHYHLNLDHKDYLKLAYEAEKLQHGHPSQLDLHIALQGGCIYFHDSQWQKRPLPQLPMFLVNTGIPDASTGECVTKVAKHFSQDVIWDQFEALTIALDTALQQNNLSKTQDLIKENHRLLCHIGVVPTYVNNFICDVERANAAAKICGAGSTKGNHAGAVLVFAKNLETLKPICKRYNYAIEAITIEEQGLRVA